MDQFIKMDVFFAVSTGAVILITALLCAMLVFIIRFLWTVNRIADEVEEEAAEIREDLHELRASMSQTTSKVFRFVPLFSFFKKTTKRLTTPKKKKTKS